MTDIPTLAARARCSLETAQRWCRLLGFRRSGRDWWLTDEQVAAVLARVQPGRGNPNWRRA